MSDRKYMRPKFRFDRNNKLLDDFDNESAHIDENDDDDEED